MNSPDVIQTQQRKVYYVWTLVVFIQVCCCFPPFSAHQWIGGCFLGSTSANAHFLVAELVLLSCTQSHQILLVRSGNAWAWAHVSLSLRVIYHLRGCVWVPMGFYHNFNLLWWCWLHVCGFHSSSSKRWSYGHLTGKGKPPKLGKLQEPPCLFVMLCGPRGKKKIYNVILSIYLLLYFYFYYFYKCYKCIHNLYITENTSLHCIG